MRASTLTKLAPLYLALVAVALIVTIRAFVPDAVPLPDAAQDFLTLGMSVVIESVPFVILGLVLSVVVQVWIPAGVLVRWLPRNAILRRAFISLFGMFFPVCECGNVPLARGFILRGFTVPESITFLVAAPILNPITIITTHQAFGWGDHILVARLVGGFLIANLLGWMFSRHPDPSKLLTPSFQAICETADDDHGGSRWSRSIEIFIRETSSIMPVLVLGSFIAAGVQVFVPREFLVAVGSDPILSIFAMIVLALIVSVCSNVDAFFVLGFAGTFLPGAIAAFLLFGPIIDVKMIALMRTTFTTRTIAQIAAVTTLVSVGIGLVINLVA